MKGKNILMILALVAAIAGGIFLSQSFADETYSMTQIQTPPSCVCSAPADLATRANRNHRHESSLQSNLEPKFLLSLYNCQCGPLTCAVTAQAVSCRK
jgi:hypothetical protein